MKITAEMAEAEVSKEQYHHFEGTTLTVCCLTLRNGFTVTGESACISSEAFDPELGRNFSRGRAMEKVWDVLAFRARDQLSKT